MSALPLALPSSLLERSFWLAVEEILGPEPLTQIVPRLHSSTPEALSFSLEQIALLQHILEGEYGPNAGRGLTLRAGRSWVKYGLRLFQQELGWNSSQFRLLPRRARISRGLSELAAWLEAHLPQRFAVETHPDGWLWKVSQCQAPALATFQSSCCYWMLGVLDEVMTRLGDGKLFPVREKSCQFCGAPVCLFEISAAPLGD